MRAGYNHDGDVPLHETTELSSGAFDRATRLAVRIEEVAADQNKVDLLGYREIDRSLERIELALTLGGRSGAKVVVARSEMNVGHVQQARHRDFGLPPGIGVALRQF